MQPGEERSQGRISGPAAAESPSATYSPPVPAVAVPAVALTSAVTMIAMTAVVLTRTPSSLTLCR